MLTGALGAARWAGARTRGVVETAAVGAWARTRGLAEAARTKSMSKDEHTVLQHVIDVLLALERKKHRAATISRGTYPYGRRGPAEVVGVGKAVELRLKCLAGGKKRLGSDTGGYTGYKHLVPNVVRSGRLEASLGGEKSCSDASAVWLEVSRDKAGIGKDHSVPTASQANTTDPEGDGRCAGGGEASESQVDGVPGARCVGNGCARCRWRSDMEDQALLMVPGQGNL